MNLYYDLLSAVFNPILAFPQAVSELFLAAIICFFITLCYRYLIDQNLAKKIKDDVKELQKKAKEAQKNKNNEEANKALNEILKLNNKQMMLNMKPMLPAFLVVILLLPWIGHIYAGKQVLLPFVLPIFGSDFSWLTWYIVISLPLTQLFRKMIGVV